MINFHYISWIINAIWIYNILGDEWFMVYLNSSTLLLFHFQNSVYIFRLQSSLQLLAHEWVAFYNVEIHWTITFVGLKKCGKRIASKLQLNSICELYKDLSTDESDQSLDEESNCASLATALDSQSTPDVTHRANINTSNRLKNLCDVIPENIYEVFILIYTILITV